jgi:hypothetical protein
VQVAEAGVDDLLLRAVSAAGGRPIGVKKDSAEHVFGRRRGRQQAERLAHAGV